MKHIFRLLVIVLFLLVGAGSVFAFHSWGNYHWARTENPFTLKVGNNLSGTWAPYLATTVSDWSASSVLDLAIVGGSGGKSCRPSQGRVEVCNKKYGNNGWLGLAQIWISGSHIVQGTTKVNDTYFATPSYNTPAWKNLVMCQEVGHTLGLDHQDENFGNANMGTCMDYTSDPSTNQHPNVHDYEELETIYAHLDSVSTVDATQGTTKPGKPSFVEALVDNPGDWGRKIKDNGYVALFERDFGQGDRLFTFVIWAK